MLRAENLVKRFEDKTALDGLNTEIRRGCIYGLVGPNGSGKTNLLEAIRSLINDKRDWADSRLLRALCDGEAYAVPRLAG